MAEGPPGETSLGPVGPASSVEALDGTSEAPWSGETLQCCGGSGGGAGGVRERGRGAT